MPSWCANSLIIYNHKKPCIKSSKEKIYHLFITENSKKTIIRFDTILVPPREFIKELLKDYKIDFGFVNQDLGIYGELYHVIDDDVRYEKILLADKQFVLSFYDLAIEPIESPIKDLYKKYQWFHLGG